MEKLIRTILHLAIVVTVTSCQRQMQNPPSPPKCSPEEVVVGNVCTKDPSGGNPRNNNPPPSINDPIGSPNGSGNTSGTEEELTPPPTSSPFTGMGTPTPEETNPWRTSAPTSSGEEQPGEVTANNEQTGSEIGKPIDPKSVASLKDLQIYVSMKSVKIGEKAGPMALFVKVSQPSSIDELSIHYIAGTVLEGETAYDPWDINAKIEFKSASNFCLVSETQFDWASYRPSEEAMGKSVPFSCKTK